MSTPWFGNNQQTIGDKIKSLFKNDREPIEKKAIIAHYRVKTALGRINSYLSKIEQRDRELFQNVVESLVKRDERKAKMYAKEVSELRKVAKQLITVQYALEHASLKLETFLVFGGAMRELQPIVSVMKEAVGIVRSLAPDVWIDLQVALRELETSMNTGVADISAEIDVGLDNDARKIFEEAKTVAEQKLKEHYAELPKILTEAEKSGEASP
ncbi:Snf7 family protein [Staphylothermus hellenicus]|uniref:Conserved protein implicated in secretion n=1 Tax=Staphylothermus hellenicus (strain DSM 12710 / JCM 10830 / BK20S6-10-b1 / P8) TaxID=591019 RepID=D7DBA9_STAHD|nr:Snf7 family protein [Staphylothermus hellenicus]ADI31456.1 Conserved protein implicated in secretion [Staphylothermus hellenicus DSM 12710]